MIGNIFNIILVWPITNILIAIYQALILINVPYALGFSIIVLTILIRLILYPLIASQLRASKKMQEIGPHLSKLKEKHKGDARKLQQETMRLYKEHGVNPAAGCLPVLIQLPIIWALYTVLQYIVTLSPEKAISYINSIVYFDFLKVSGEWESTFFGLPLGQTPGQLLPSLGYLILLVPILTGVLQYVQSKMMFAKPAATQDKNKPKKEDFASMFQSQSLYIFPVMIAFFSYSFPIGLSLYWNTFTIFGIIQQYQISGWGGFKKN